MKLIRSGFWLALFFFFLMNSPLHAQNAPTEPPSKAGESVSTPPAAPPPPESPMPSAMLRAIEQRKSELDKRARELDQKEERLRLMEQEIGRMLKKSTEAREALEATEKKRKQEEERQVARLAKMYEAMPPDQAAARIEKLDESLELMLLGKIKEKSAAQILTGLNATKAAQLTEKLVKTAR